MGLRYAEHTADEAGVKVLAASHFVQQYSLLWEGSGLLSEGRAGTYDLALGYQWNQVDAEIDGAEVDVDNPLDKILFKGDLLLAPGGLPFRLHVYSYDMESSSLGYQAFAGLFGGQEYDRQPGIITGVQNGSNVTTGLTLMAGVKNGSYRGVYRDLLTSLPRLFVDFRQTDVKDSKGTYSLHYTDRDLAFVSLNKNKNWFHYRFYTHDDKIDPTNNYEEQTYLVGTIDHVNRRQWVDLTNWIQLSTDISYSETTPSQNATESYQERYDYNFFSTAQRSNWSGGTYASFSRVRDKNSLGKSLQVPVFAKGRLNRDTTWRVRLETQSSQNISAGTGVGEEVDNLFLAARLEVNANSRYVLAPALELEHKGGSQGQGHALRAGVEVYGNQRYRTDTDVFGSYYATLIEGTAEAGEDVSYFEQQLVGRFSRDITSNLSSALSQEFVWGTGLYNSSTADFVGTSVDSISSLGGSSTGTVDGTYLRSISGWSLDHRPASRIYNRVGLGYDYIRSPADSGGQLSIVHNLNYYGRALKASINNELILGSSLHDSFSADLDLIGGSSIIRQGGTVSNSFESSSSFSYDPDRRHHNAVDVELEWRMFESGGSDQSYKFTQLYEYTFWKDRGLFRKIATLGEEFEYEDYVPSFGDSSSLLSFSLFSELYPTRQTLLSARLRYEVNTTTESDTALVFLSAGVDFEKFQMQFDYAYGTRTAGIDQPERVEHKWEMQVKKTF